MIWPQSRDRKDRSKLSICSVTPGAASAMTLQMILLLFFLFSGLVRGIATYWSVRWTAALKGFKSFYFLKVLPRWGMRRKQSKYGIIRRPSEILFLRRNANCMVLGQEFITWSHTLGYCYLSPALSRGIRIFLKGLLGMYFLFRFSDWYSSAVALRVVIEHWAASGLGRRFSG